MNESEVRSAKLQGKLETQIELLQKLQTMTQEVRFARPIAEITEDDEEIRISMAYWTGYLAALQRVSAELSSISYTKDSEKSLGKKEDGNV